MKTLIAFLSVCLALVVGCKGDSGTRTGGATLTSGGSPAASVTINGAGATFPFPLYSKWVAQYQASHPNAKINYQSIGSGAGIRQLTDKTVDFGASDTPMTDDQLAKAQGKIVHIPMTLGAVVVTYDVPGLAAPLKLTPELCAGIFLGDIKRWDDPKLKDQNPGAKLPAAPINVVHRSDGSGTTAVFTDYLSKVSGPWKSKVGQGTSVSWPVGLGAKGNKGVTGQVKTTPGALGYVELAYAVEQKLPMAELKNKTGEFVAPTLASITAAAASFSGQVPDDLRMSIVDPEGALSYPIASFSYILVYEDSQDTTKSIALAKFLWWAIHEGQVSAPALSYALLPSAIVVKAEAKLRTLKAAGKAILAGS